MILRVSCPYANNSSILDRTEKSISMLKESGLFDEVQVGRVRGAYISNGRNQVINAKWDGNKLIQNYDNRKYQELSGFDYYLSIDSDMEFAPEQVEALLNRNLPIVSAKYKYRFDDQLSVSGKYLNNIEGLTHISNFFTMSSKGLNEVDWFGSGMFLCTRQTIQSMSYPWFWMGLIEYKEDGLTKVSYITEDVGFCINARRHGFQLFVDFDTKVIHHT